MNKPSQLDDEYQPSKGEPVPKRMKLVIVGAMAIGFSLEAIAEVIEGTRECIKKRINNLKK
jgi:hypothetical protein